MDKDIKIIVSMVCVTAIEVVALIKGIDGQVLITALGAVAGLGGYIIGRKVKE